MMDKLLGYKEKVFLQAELLVARSDNSIEMGMFWGSSLDFD